MGLIKTCFTFAMGTGFGVYVAQNYDVPNIKRLFEFAVVTAKTYEQIYRKSKKERDD